MQQHETIDYLELPSNDFAKTKTFFKQVFNWKFTDFGDHYIAFTSKTIMGGFFKSTLNSNSNNGATLIVFYSEHLEKTQQKIIKANGKITKSTFSFPGGKRFHFIDPVNNEYAVWSDK